MARYYGQIGGGPPSQRYHCGGAWGQQENLTVDEVAAIVRSTPGPHHVWAPGMADWVPAESVPEITQALAGLGGTTVPPESEVAVLAAPARDRPTKASRPMDKQTQKAMWRLGGIVSAFIMFLLGAVLFFGERSSGPVPVVVPEPEVVAAPAPPPSPPRIDAVARRPVSWTNQALRDARGESGTAEASSELRERGGRVHGARNVADSRPSTAWCEGNASPGGTGEGEGEWIQLATPCEGAAFREVVGLELLSGFTDKPDDWKQNNRPAKGKLTMTLDGRVRLVASVFLADGPGPQFLELPRALLCQEGETVRAKLEVERVYSGTNYSDTCISGLALYERQR
jgi:hypothetical protein